RYTFESAKDYTISLPINKISSLVAFCQYIKTLLISLSVCRLYGKLSILIILPGPSRQFDIHLLSIGFIQKKTNDNIRVQIFCFARNINHILPKSTRTWQ